MLLEPCKHSLIIHLVFTEPSVRLAHSPNGWTDSELALQWLEKDFDAKTKDKAGRHTHVLLMDSHNSHYTPQLLEYAHAHNIIILGYPPHCTHTLQGLDVVCFAKMKNEFRWEIQKFKDLHMEPVKKSDFAGVFGHAYLQAFTPVTVKAAFAATGVYLFNPNIISEKQMRPSLPTSTKSTFPVLQTSLIHTIIVVLGSQPPTAFELSPTTHSASVAGPSHLFPVSPVTPTRRRLLNEPEMDTVLETPSKSMRTLYEELATTLSGSLLISKARMSSAYKITAPVLEAMPELPKPNWSLLREGHARQSKEMLIGTNKQLTESLARARNVI